MSQSFMWLEIYARFNQMNFKADFVTKFFYGLFSILYVCAAMHLPLSIFTHFVHDDAWYIKSAQSILDGNWLGEFSQMTLIKGLGYPYFLIFNNLLGIPVTLAQALLFIAACFLLIYALRRVGLPSLVALVLFFTLLFQPALFPTRVLRDGIYFSLLIISISGLIVILLCRKNEGGGNLLVLSSGFVFGLFWITREEGVWVLPSLLVMIALSIWLRHKNSDSNNFIFRNLLLYGLAASVAPISTSLINKFWYGEFQTVDVKSASFVKALNALNSVDAGGDVQFVPVPAKSRAAIYGVSPAFKELEPLLEGSLQGWKEHGCKSLKTTCGDYAGGWFMWALRDGAAALGYYKTPESARVFFDRISAEVSTACASGALLCKKNMVPFMPRMTSDAMRSIPEKMMSAIGLTVYGKNSVEESGESSGSVSEVKNFLNFLGNPRIVPPAAEHMTRFSGWYYSPDADWFHVRCGFEAKEIYIPVGREASPDISAHFNDSAASHSRFSFELGSVEGCIFSFEKSKIGPIVAREPLHGKKSFIGVDRSVINFDVAEEITENQKGYLIGKKILSRPFAVASPVIFGLGVISFFVACGLIASRASKANAIIIIAASVWIMYLSRIVIIVMVDITSFSAINVNYLRPAFALWIIASVLSIYALFASMAASKIGKPLSVIGKSKKE